MFQVEHTLQSSFQLPVLTIVSLCWSFTICPSWAYEYNDSRTLLEDLLDKRRYNPELRPRINQDQATTIHVAISTVSIVSLDDVSQQLTASVVASFTWQDQLLAWNETSYGKVTGLTISSGLVWKPKLSVLNAVNQAYAFGEDESKVVVSSSGMVMWFSWSVISATCDLDVTKYPFDKQSCYFTICPFGYSNVSVNFKGMMVKGEPFIGEWDLVSQDLKMYNIGEPNTEYISCLLVSYTLERKAIVVILNIILPVILLSVINTFVFVIPVDSGEKISFAVTVLLAQALSLSLVSNLLPRSGVPKLTIYLCCSLGMSVLTVLLTIVVVSIYNAGQNMPSDDNGMSLKDQLVHENGFGRERNCKTESDTTVTAGASNIIPSINRYDVGPATDKMTIKRRLWSQENYRNLSKIVDKTLFVLFLVFVISMTIWFFSEVAD